MDPEQLSVQSLILYLHRDILRFIILIILWRVNTPSIIPWILKVVDDKVNGSYRSIPFPLESPKGKVNWLR